MIINRFNMEDLEVKTSYLPHHRRGLQYTRSGYGNKIPTTKMVKLPGNPRWRRVYCCIHSNIGTSYVTSGKDWIVIN